MDKKEYNATMKILRASRKKALSSKAAARKFLKDAGVLHLLVPIDPEKKKIASKKKKVSPAKKKSR